MSVEDRDPGLDDRRPDEDGGGWDERLTEAARRYHEPPATPRERIWERIAAARQSPVVVDESPRPRRPWWYRRERLWPAAAAAALVAGVLLGRWWSETPFRALERAERQFDGSTITGSAVVPLGNDGARDHEAQFLARAARPLFGRAETLLLQFRTSTPDEANPPHFSARAMTLLTQTRLLLASPAATDPDLKVLLEDLELALARVVCIAAEQRAEERSTLTEALEHQTILTRLRTRLDTDDALPRL